MPAAAANRMSGPSSRTISTALVVLGVLFAALLLVTARGDLWFDEVFSVKFARMARSPFDIFLALPHDNNHPLNTLFLYFVPAGSPFLVYRLLSVAAGIGSLVVAGRLTKREWGPAEAICAVALIGTSYPLVLYFSEARGYAPAIFFGLVAYDQLLLNLKTFRWRHVAGFWLASILGILSQSTFVILSGAFLLLELAQTVTARERNTAGRFVCHQIAPLLFIGLWWQVFVSRMAIAGGPIENKWDVIQQAAGLLIGLPDDLATFRLPALCLVLTIIAAGSFCLARDRSIEWVFYPSVLVIVPAAVILITRPKFFYFRYLLVSFPFFYLLLAYLACRLFRTSPGPFRVLAVVAAGLMLTGHAAHLIPLVMHGRGNYLHPLEEIAAQDSDSVIRVGSDHDFRNGLLVEFYAPLLPSGKKMEYVAQNRLSQSVPNWFITHTQDLGIKPEPNLVLPGIGVYRLVNESPYAGVSGWAWFIYHRETTSDRPVHIESR